MDIRRQWRTWWVLYDQCCIWEPRTTPSAGWYSKKFNRAGLAYELGVAIFHNQIVWINGPFPARQNDLKIFRKENGLMSKIPDGMMAVRKFKRRVLARHETVNSRLKAFKILNENFRTTGEIGWQGTRPHLKPALSLYNTSATTAALCLKFSQSTQ